MEIWKELNEVNLSNYEISTQGKIRNKKTGNLTDYNYLKQDKYIQLNFVDDFGSHVTYLLHRLLAKTFILNPDNRPIVDHIDKNKFNNNIYNLRWVSDIESNKNRNYAKVTKARLNAIIQYDLENNIIREWSGLQEASEILNLSSNGIKRALLGLSKTSGGFIWKKKEDKIEGELWKEIKIDNRDILISNLGRIKLKNGRITTGSLHNKYYRLTIGKKTYSVHRLVCMVFNKVKNYEFLDVDHINRITTDNRSENLRFVTTKINCLNSNKKYQKIGLKPIIQFDKNMNRLKEFNSIREASIELNIHESSISSVCREKRKTCKGYIFKFNYEKK